MLTGKHLIITCAALSFASISATSLAAPLTNVVVAPSCLIKAAKFTPKIIAADKEYSLVELSSTDMKKLKNAKHTLKKPCGSFLNVTTEWHQFQASPLAVKNSASFLSTFTVAPTAQRTLKSNYAIRFQTQTNQLIKQLNPTLMWDNLTTFSSSKDRYADSENGLAAAKWIASQMESTVRSAGRQDVTISFIETSNYLQPSVVVKVGDSNEPGIVIGAHMDTTESYTSNKPGADDDGSGSMTIMESARTLIESGMTFKKPIYFIWYAAEEDGLIGSQHVVADFKKKKVAIDAVIHFDMTGYAYKNQPTIWLIDDYVDNELTKFLATIITTYTQRPIQHTRCGYACSDHASWTLAGFKASIPAESRFEDTNPAAHSSHDTIDKLSLSHMTDYAKIATAFAVELAEPTI